MSIFNWGDKPPEPMADIAGTFKELAQPLFERGDIDGVNRVYEKAYAKAMQGRKRGTMEEMQVQHKLGQALHDVLTQTAHERKRYFENYGDIWWRT